MARDALQSITGSRIARAVMARPRLTMTLLMLVVLLAVQGGAAAFETPSGIDVTATSDDASSSGNVSIGP